MTGMASASALSVPRCRYCPGATEQLCHTQPGQSAGDCRGLCSRDAGVQPGDLITTSNLGRALQQFDTDEHHDEDDRLLLQMIEAQS